MKTSLVAAWVLFAAATVFAAEESSNVIEVERLPPMPVAMANNAVALVPGEQLRIFSMLGLETGKTWEDASSMAMQYTAGESVLAGSWKTLPPVPGKHGRLAASAVTVGGDVFLFGGYTVASDGSEESTLEVYRLDPDKAEFETFATMPVPVEDSVLVVHRDRWVYLVSGWHDLGNVNLVQVLDTETREWSQATPFPGQPVFGHAGGITGDTIVVCDGVRIEYPPEPDPRRFLPSDECWKGMIQEDNHRRIDWRRIKPHPGAPLYRMAASGDGAGRIWFAGGSDNPYNFNGIGYNGQPSEPSSPVFSYHPDSGAWEQHGKLEVATMDHRGLLHHDGWFYIVGGMRAGQQVTAEFIRFRPEIDSR